MKELRVYICEVCGKTYKTPNETVQCEKSHPPIKTVVPGRKCYCCEDGFSIPAAVVITFVGGKREVYELPLDPLYRQKPEDVL